MNQDIRDCLTLIQDSLVEHKNDMNAVKMKAYMRGQYEYLGLKSPVRREAIKPFIVHVKNWGIQDIITLASALWALPEREYKYTAMDILGKHMKKMDEDCISFVIDLILAESWWDTVDYLASTLIGHLMKKYPDQRPAYVEEWIKNDNIWIKRTALIFQLKYKQETDIDLLEYLIQQEMTHPDFFIRKAIGWSLRQYSRYNPDRVLAFVRANPQLSPLSQREALRLLK